MTIAEKIDEEKLNEICQMLKIKEENLQDWLLHPHGEKSIAYRMLYFWLQVQDEYATVQHLTKVFKDCEQKEAILALNP